MKIKNLIIAGTILVSVATFAQKEEIKTLKKIYDKEVKSADDIATYNKNLSRYNAMANDEVDVVYSKFYKTSLIIFDYYALGKNPTAIQVSDVLTPKAISEITTTYKSVLDYEKKSGTLLFTDKIKKDVVELKPRLLNAAIGLADQKKYKESSDVLYSIYLLDTKDAEKLFYAANYALNANDLDTALKYFQELKTIKYSGEATVLYAKNKESKKEEVFNNKTERDLYIKAGSHESPRDEKLPSKRGEIYRYIAQILIEKGRTKEAITAVSEARIENPDDISLVTAEADLYYKMGDMETYKILINRAIEKKPNDATLVFNLGVVSANAKQLADAEKYYKRAIELDPKYVDAYINLSEILLRADQPIFDEIKKLTTSDKDNKRYDVLNAQRKANFKGVIPYLEKAIEYSTKEDTLEAAQKTLLSMYKALDMDDKVKELKAKMKK